MNSDNKLYACAWFVVGVILITLILTMGAYNINNDYQRKEALLHGVSPIAVSCAFSSSYISPQCTLLATEHGSRLWKE